ncbi:MAG: homoserine kinase [Planctomycetes bacterium]|nr:homoserine kinase [Planctomycetota bacterium]MCB9905967.1 homoserine kinase [Planctomycetota bacterium]
MSNHGPANHLRRARLRVPCSTSNLGPGFDCLGLALGLWLDVELVGEAGDAHELIAAEGTAREWPQASNLLFRAFDRVFAERELTAPRARFAVRSEIPLERGLGSSGAAVAAGLLLANEFVSDRLAIGELARLGMELEGHPDNSTASLHGGCTLGVPLAGGLRVLQPELSPRLRFAVAWSDAKLATDRARAALPREVPFADAVENPRRIALLLEGLKRADPDLIAAGGEDRLHVPYRLPLIPGGAEALTAARDAGAWLATISGAGSALVAITDAACCDGVARAMADALAPHAEWTEHHALEAALGAPRIA